MKQLLLAASAATLSVEVAAACDISDYVGWTIIYSGTVTGYIDENGKIQDEFNGCEHNRVLIIDSDKVVTCNEYSYSYAYHPDIVILSRGSSLKACIDNEMYDVRR